MAQPSSAITRFDLSMSYVEFSFAANRRKFIGLKALPPIGVMQEASDFLRLDVESFLTKPEDTRRAPKSTYKRDDYEWTKDSYACDEHGVEEIADDATIERYGDILRVEQIAIMRAVNRILQSLEQDIADAVMNTTTWAGASLTTAVTAIGSSGNVAWSTKATADPIAHIDHAREKVKTSSGMTPNAVIMTDTDFINCIRTDRIEALLKYDASALMLAMNRQIDSSMLSDATSGLAGLFNVDKILIGQGFKNTADKGQTATFGRFWPAGKVMVCHINDDGMTGDLESPFPSIGRTIFSTKNGEPLPGSDDAGFGSLMFDEYREEQRRGAVFRPRNKRQVKILHKEAGHLLTAVS